MLTEHLEGLRARLPLLAAWMGVAGAELFFGLGACAPPTEADLVVEGLALGGLGLAHALLAPEDWRAGTAWPGLLLVGVAAWGVISDRLGSGWGHWLVLVLTILVLGRLLGQWSRLRTGWGAAVLWVVSSSLSARLLVLYAAEMDVPHRRLIASLKVPAERLSESLKPPISDPPLVVLTVDTLRVDRALEMASWRWLIAHGAGWERAMSTASWTLPAVASVWTGVLPGEHGCGRSTEGFFQPLRADAPWLVEQLGDRGYRTAAFVVNPFLSSELGFRRGFDRWWNPAELVAQPLIFGGSSPAPDPRDAQQVVSAALDWLSEVEDEGFLLWVHLFEPHLPYRHAPSDSPSRAVQSPMLVREGKVGASPAVREATRRDYTREVAHADAQIQRLIQALEARDFFARGTLVFASDHGEELWDHQRFEHGHSHHGEVVDVPLAVVSPGVEPGLRGGVASLIDVAPTLREVVGLSAQGLDLRQGVPADRVAVAVGNLYGEVQRSARSSTTRLILTELRGRTEARRYAIERDPLEQDPLPVPSGEPLLPVAQGLQTAAEGIEAPVHRGALRTLGYLE